MKNIMTKKDKARMMATVTMHFLELSSDYSENVEKLFKQYPELRDYFDLVFLLKIPKGMFDKSCPEWDGDTMETCIKAVQADKSHAEEIIMELADNLGYTAVRGEEVV